MSQHEQELEDLKLRCDLLIRTVHEMNDLIHELRDENCELKETIEELHNG